MNDLNREEMSRYVSVYIACVQYGYVSLFKECHKTMSVFWMSALQLCQFIEWVHYNYVSLLNECSTAMSVYWMSALLLCQFIAC